MDEHEIRLTDHPGQATVGGGRIARPDELQHVAALDAEAGPESDQDPTTWRTRVVVAVGGTDRSAGAVRNAIHEARRRRTSQ